MFRIEMQEEGRGEGRHPVKCKLCEFFPITDKKTRQTKFGKLKTPVLRLLLTDGAITHKITFSKGVYTYHQADKMEHPRLDTGRIMAKSIKAMNGFRDTLSPKVRVPGEKESFHNHAQFWAKLAASPAIGPVLAAEIQEAFESRLGQKRKAA